MSDPKRSSTRAVRAPRLSNKVRDLIATLIAVGAATVLAFGCDLHLTPWQGFWILTLYTASGWQARYHERARHESR